MSKNNASAAGKLFAKQDAGAAMSEYQHAKKAEALKTERLRALRLAKEAEDREAATKAKAEADLAKKEKAAAKRRKKA